jgi:hypothetical protein
MRLAVDYIDADVAYLLGMILARGTFVESPRDRRLIIGLPFRNETLNVPDGYSTKWNVGTENTKALNVIRNRVNELLEVNIDISEGGDELKAVFPKSTMAWRNLRLLTGNKDSYREFEVEDFLFDAPEDILQELVRGFADVSAIPNKADADQVGTYRIVLPVQHQNWKLPIQLCRVLQTRLGVAVSHILWGHPNLRDPQATGKQWRKEHRIRIFAQDFVRVGFSFAYKSDVLKFMAKRNLLSVGIGGRLCNPKGKKKAPTAKKRHKDEKSRDLPDTLRGKHFSHYAAICKACGCKQGTREPFLFVEDADA